jgi:tyrosyl-tRNA synthetase
MTIDFLSDMQTREVVHQMTESDLPSALAQGPVTGYIGFDPSAASLHVGSLLQILALVRFQRAGHRPIAIAGGATGLVGDPSGKDSERELLTAEHIEANLAGIRSQLERYLDFDGPRGAVVLNNHEWLGQLSLIDFLRDVGKHFSVNAMVARDSVRVRLEQREQGISYTEFTYMLLQAYDFVELYRRFGCTLQMGGSDQWGNIVSGADLIRRMHGTVAHGLTFHLVTRGDGKKFGKSEQGNVWLDPQWTSPYDFYQFWLNADDADALRYLKQFTFLSVAEIDELGEEQARVPERRAAQKTLAEEVTRFVHGADALTRAQNASRALFGGGDWHSLTAQELEEAFRHTPSSTLPRAALGSAEASLASLLASAGLTRGKGQARRDIQQGGVYLNNQRVRDAEHSLDANDLLAGTFAVLRRGKKTYHVVRVEAE